MRLIATCIFALTTPFALAVTSDLSEAPWADLKSQLWASTPQSVFRITDVAANEGPKTLLLKRYEVVAQGAQIVLHREMVTETLRMPVRHYFYGTLGNTPYSHVWLVVAEDGQTRGLVKTDAGMFALTEQQGTQLRMQALDLRTAQEPFQCGNNSLPDVPRDTALTLTGEFNSGAAPQGNSSYMASIAIETDNEFLDLFSGDTTDATNYITDLVAYASSIYQAEIQTGLQISHINLWDGVQDPWEETGTACGMLEFGQYWNDNNGAVDRTIAHFLSGKNNGGGIAWVGVLCNGAFNTNADPYGCSTLSGTDNFGGAYGYTGDLDANFDLNNPSAVWDIVAFTHEVGHNFNSPHTHCYAGLNGNAQPIDECFGSEDGGSCYAGSPSLPCAVSGDGCGTIMSYCHLLSGGLGNISLSLGTDHPWGIEPDRVPTRMRDHVENRAGVAPMCLPETTSAELTLTGPATITEGEPASFDLTLSEAVMEDVTIDLQVDGDLVGRLSNLSGHTISAGDTSTSANLTAIDNLQDAPDIAGNLSIGTITTVANVTAGTPDNLLLTIIDDDPPTGVTVTLTSDSVIIDEGGLVNVTAHLDSTTTVPVDITVALTGALVGRTGSNLGPHTITAGSTEVTFSLDFDDNELDEPHQVGTIDISNAQSDASTTIGSPDFVGLTLLDNDLVGTLAVDTASAAAGSTFTFTVTLDQTATQDVAVTLQADANLPFAPDADFGQHLIDTGETQVSIPLTTVTSGAPGPDESGTVSILLLDSGATTILGTPDNVMITVQNSFVDLIFSSGFGD